MISNTELDVKVSLSDKTFLTDKSEIIKALYRKRVSLRSPTELDSFILNQFQNNSFSSSLFHHPDQDFYDWKQRTLPLLEEALIIPNSLGEPSEPVLLKRTEFPDYIVEELEINVTASLRAPATVVIPRNGERVHPSVIALHSMGGLQIYGRKKLLAFENEPEFLTQYRKRYYDGHSLQISLAQAGFLSIAIDALNFGERIDRLITKDIQQSVSLKIMDKITDKIKVHTNSNERLLRCVGSSTAAVTATDDIRTVDYLVTREDVDVNRIGCTGLSFGAFRTHYLAALDSRIKVGVSACWLSSMRGIIDYNPLGAMGFFSFPNTLYRHLDLVDIPALIAPKPFLAISGWNDRLMQAFGIAEAHLFLRKTWENARVLKSLGSLVYDSGHVYNHTMQNTAICFLKRHLNINQ